MDEKEIQRRRAAAERIIRERHEALRREEKEKIKKSIEAHREMVAKELRREQEALQRRMLILDQDQLRKKEVLNKTHAVTSRTANLNGAAGTNSRGSPKKYAFGSSTPRELSYLDNPNIPKDFKAYDKKLLPVVGKEAPPLPSQDEIRRKSTPMEKRLAARTTNAMSTSMYVPSKAQNQRQTPPRSNMTLSSRTSPPTTMTQSVYVTPKRPATTVTTRRDVTKNATSTARTPSSTPRSGTNRSSPAKDSTSKPRPATTTAKKPPIPAARNNALKEEKKIEKPPIANRKKVEETPKKIEKPEPPLRKEIPTEPLISFELPKEEKSEELPKEHANEEHTEEHKETEKVESFSNDVAQETLSEAIITSVQALSGDDSSDVDVTNHHNPDSDFSYQNRQFAPAVVDNYELQYSDRPAATTTLSHENPLMAQNEVFQMGEVFTAEPIVKEAEKRETSVPFEISNSEEVPKEFASIEHYEHHEEKSHTGHEVSEHHENDINSSKHPNEHSEDELLSSQRPIFETEPQGMSLADEMLIDMSQETVDTVPQNAQNVVENQEERLEKPQQSPTSKPPTPPVTTVKIPSLEPEVRAKQEAENREYEERKARIAEILARSRATVQEVKSESSLRSMARERDGSTGNATGSTGHSSDEDLNGYGRTSESATRRSSTQTSSSTASGAQIPDVLKKLAAKHNMPSLNKIIQRHESDPKLNNSPGATYAGNQVDPEDPLMSNHHD